MANHKSSLKRVRQTIVKTVRNSKIKSTVRTFEKKLRSAISKKDSATASQILTNLRSRLGKAVQKKVYHKNNAARKISRLAKQIQKISS